MSAVWVDQWTVHTTVLFQSTHISAPLYILQNELAIYKRDNGHCNVPQRYKDNPPLGIWCNTQRALFKAGKLSTERIGKLNELGFEWALRASRKMKREDTEPPAKRIRRENATTETLHAQESRNEAQVQLEEKRINERLEEYGTLFERLMQMDSIEAFNFLPTKCLREIESDPDRIHFFSEQIRARIEVLEDLQWDRWSQWAEQFLASPDL